jgi:hypothetical protein
MSSEKTAEKKATWSAKDWVTLCLAVWGAGLSSALAYNTLLVTDDVRVEFDHLFMVHYFRDQVLLRNSMNVVFINAGNRPAAFRRITMDVGPDCRGAMLDVQLDPFVLKEKDIVLKELKFAPAKDLPQKVEMSLTHTSISYPLPEPIKPTEIAACMSFEVSTPSFPRHAGLEYRHTRSLA